MLALGDGLVVQLLGQATLCEDNVLGALGRARHV